MNATSAPAGGFLDTSKAMACVHCGLCLGSCPTYLETGNENESPRGRIYLMRALDEGRAALNEQTVGHIDLCLGCRACEVACPSGVEYGGLLESTREHIEKHYKRSTPELLLRRGAIEKIFPRSWLLKLALWPARAVRGMGLENKLPRFLRDALELIPKKFSSHSLPELVPIPTNVHPKGRVGFISGCVMPVMFGDTNRSSAKLLAEAGYEVLTPRQQVCCGALHAHSGRLDLARECARKNIDAFGAHPLDAIIINAAGCGSTLKEYGHLLAQDPAYAAKAEAFSKKVKDITEWLPRSNNGPKANGPKVTYHDACHLAHAQRITKQPRDLIKGMAGDNYVELPESDVCCGSAGTYNLTEPEMAERLQKRKIQHITQTGAQIVVTTNPGCLLQIQAGLEKARARHIKAMHISDFLEQYPKMASAPPRLFDLVPPRTPGEESKL